MLLNLNDVADTQTQHLRDENRRLREAIIALVLSAPVNDVGVQELPITQVARAAARDYRVTTFAHLSTGQISVRVEKKPT
jgi:hypothetical protein